MIRPSTKTYLLFSFFGAIIGSFLTLSAMNMPTCPANQISSNVPQHFLIVLVLSAPQNTDRRTAMRQTWLSSPFYYTDRSYASEMVPTPHYDAQGFIVQETIEQQREFIHGYNNQLKIQSTTTKRKPLNVKIYFAVGTAQMHHADEMKLKLEAHEYGDMMLLPDLADSYNNLTLKLVKSLQKLESQANYEYIFKCDDDTFASVDILGLELTEFEKKLHGIRPKPDLYWGYFNGRAQIKQHGQWQETHFQLSDRYLPYTLGGGYVISRGVAQFVVRNSEMLSKFVSEDISMGVWTAGLRTVYRRHDVRFDTGWMGRDCHDYHIVRHKQDIDNMKRAHKGMSCVHQFLEKQKRKRPPEYFYDWDGFPSKCCDTLVGDLS